MADVKKPPGTEFGTSLSPSVAQTAATIKNRINPNIDIVCPPYLHSFPESLSGIGYGVLSVSTCFVTVFCR